MGEARGLWSPNFNFQTKQGPKISVSNIRDIAFCGYSEIMWLHFWKIYGGFSFFSNYIEEIDRFTLDLLKRSDT